MSNIVNNVKLNFNQKHNAFPYQVEAFNFVKDLDYAAIFHEQGLGKTKIAIDLLLYWLQFRDIDTVLIVTKKQLIKNWSDEIRQHSFLAPRQLGTDRTANFYVLNSATKVVITNFETILTEFERINLFLKARNVALIVDESAKLKNPETKLTKSFFEISGLFKIRLIMTGTPVANRPYDIWSQIFILDHGKALGENFIEFKKEADLSNHYNDDLDARNKFEDNISSIFDKIKSFSIRETKNSTGIELPSKNY